MNTWKDGNGSEVFKAEWESVTKRLRESGYNLKIPLTPKYMDAQERAELAKENERCELRELIFSYYHGNSRAITMFAGELGVTKTTVYKMLKGDYPIARKHKPRICEILGISPGEEARYFDKPIKAPV